MWIYLGVSENEVYPQLAICEWENAVRLHCVLGDPIFRQTYFGMLFLTKNNEYSKPQKDNSHVWVPGVFWKKNAGRMRMSNGDTTGM